MSIAKHSIGRAVLEALVECGATDFEILNEGGMRFVSPSGAPMEIALSLVTEELAKEDQ